MSTHTSNRPKHWKQALAAGAGGMLVIGLLAGTRSSTLPLLMGSFGSSAVLVFGFPESGFCKPLRVIGAHMLCSAIGLACLHLFGEHAWSLGLSVGLSITLMLGLRLVHPPAGSNPLLVYALHPGWTFLLWPVLLGSTALVVGAALWRCLVAEQPKHGETPPQP
ncbi:MAG: HPP family protein [Verrucomicrobiaceae bacterium]